MAGGVSDGFCVTVTDEEPEKPLADDVQVMLYANAREVVVAPGVIVAVPEVGREPAHVSPASPPLARSGRLESVTMVNESAAACGFAETAQMHDAAHAAETANAFRNRMVSFRKTCSLFIERLRYREG